MLATGCENQKILPKFEEKSHFTWNQKFAQRCQHEKIEGYGPKHGNLVNTLLINKIRACTVLKRKND